MKKAVQHIERVTRTYSMDEVLKAMQEHYDDVRIMTHREQDAPGVRCSFVGTEMVITREYVSAPVEPAKPVAAVKS